MMGTAGIGAQHGLLAWGFRGGAHGARRWCCSACSAFVASFAVSLGPIMWVLLSEIFP